MAKDTKKSLNYNVEALKKGVVITDHIHGEATVIIKSDLDGFTIYGFEEDNLMSKNALNDLDMWKSKAEEIMKTKQSKNRIRKTKRFCGSDERFFASALISEATRTLRRLR